MSHSPLLGAVPASPAQAQPPPSWTRALGKAEAGLDLQPLPLQPLRARSRETPKGEPQRWEPGEPDGPEGWGTGRAQGRPHRPSPRELRTGTWTPRLRGPAVAASPPTPF